MDIVVNRVSFLLLLAAVFSLVAPALAHGEDNPYAPQPQSSLQQMLSIDWKKGPDLPQGFQDSDGGILNGTLVTAGGFCQGQTDVPGKPDKYPRGFLQKTWGLDLQSPQNGWDNLPDFPGTARQELFSAVVNNQLYCWGGFSYSDPYCYADGYRLSKTTPGGWSWDALPALPWPIFGSGISVIGPKIYVVGGSDYDYEKFYTNTDRAGNVPRLGSRLLTLDTQNLGAGWTELAECPGTPRLVQATAAVDGKLYVFGGATGMDNPTGSYATVVDNWRYDPATNAWQRLQDLPVASGNFPSRQIVALDRYILLIGGAQYGNVIAPDGSVQPVYGTPIKHYPEKDYYSDMWVYDTQIDQFGTATPLPLNNNLPMAVVEGNQIHLIGGETGGAVIEGEPFGHHPDLYLTGTIRELPEPSALGLLGAGAIVLIGYHGWKWRGAIGARRTAP